jgi:hypothetical protein
MPRGDPVLTRLPAAASRFILLHRWRAGTKTVTSGGVVCEDGTA